MSETRLAFTFPAGGKAKTRELEPIVGKEAFQSLIYIMAPCRHFGVTASLEKGASHALTQSLRLFQKGRFRVEFNAPVMTPSSYYSRHEKAQLAIDFLIVGGGIAGLSCALALSRVGHQVLVLEKDDGVANASDNGMQIPPNMSKILFRWGLKYKLHQHGLVSRTMCFTKYDSGEYLGTQVWDEDVLEESHGDVFSITHRRLHHIFHEAAISSGARIRHNATVAHIDGVKGEVRLTTGEVLTADVIVGADGPMGLSRREVMGQKDRGKLTGIALYVSTVSAKHVSSDLVNEIDRNTIVALGDRRCMVSYPVDTEKFGLHYYTYENVDDRQHVEPAVGDLNVLMAGCEPRLQQMARHAMPATRIPVKRCEHTENWIHEDGRLLLIGEAAHPFPSGSIQRTAMAVEDAAVLGKLFSHLSKREQITHFIWAFQDLRQPRVRSLFPDQIDNVLFTTMEDGDAQIARDEEMREKYKSGKSVLDKLTENPEWDKLRITFGYDCEDEADNWWVQWGVLREQAYTQNQRNAGLEIISMFRGVLANPLEDLPVY